MRSVRSDVPRGGLSQLQEILQDHPSVFGQDALGMKLNTPDGELFVFHAHDLTFVSLSRNFEAVRK